MRIVVDSDVLVYALHIPGDPAAMKRHTRAVALFDSFVISTNELFIPSTVVIEVAATLSKIVGEQLAEVNVNDLIAVASEIYPMSPSLAQTWFLSVSSYIYFKACLNNALKYTRVPKDMVADTAVPGFTSKRDEVRIGGMDIFVLTYAEVRDAPLLTNDWSLWYAAWKTGLRAYWISGLSDQQVAELAQGKSVSYPL